MDLRKNFSERLHTLRISKGITLAQLGEHLGVTDEAVRLLEKSKRSPSFEVLCALAEYFEVSLDYLTGVDFYQFDNLKEVELENYVYNLLIAMGYKIIKEHDFHDNRFDILAERDNKRTAIEIKKYVHNTSREFFLHFHNLCVECKIDQAILITRDYLPASAIKAATEQNIQVWDRRTLIELDLKYNDRSDVKEKR